MKKLVFNKYKFITSDINLCKEYFSDENCRAWVDDCHNCEITIKGELVHTVIGKSGLACIVSDFWCDEMEVL